MTELELGFKSSVPYTIQHLWQYPVHKVNLPVTKPWEVWPHAQLETRFEINIPLKYSLLWDYLDFSSEVRQMGMSRKIFIDFWLTHMIKLHVQDLFITEEEDTKYFLRFPSFPVSWDP